MRTFTVSLPLPPRGLVNAKGAWSWQRRRKVVAEARETAYVCALLATKSQKPKLAKSIVSMTYDVSPQKLGSGYRPRDVQNAVIACKAYIDGCKDAGLIVDDSARHLAWGDCQITRGGKPGVTLVFVEVA